MNIWILNRDFVSVGIVDDYESFIWTDRYNESGEFELYISPKSKSMQYLLQDYYLYYGSSDHLMIIETIEINSDTEDGSHAIVTGRSLESILERRIIWNQTTVSGSVQNAIQNLLNESIINPSDSKRKISNFIFEASTDEKITSLTYEAQYTGDVLLDVIRDICESFDIGFRIVLNDSNQFVFSLYVGESRTYDQYVLPYVIFSTEFDNLLSSNYVDSTTTIKTVALVAGEDRDQNRKTKEVYSDDTKEGLDRRELYIDARDIQSENDEGDPIPESTYYEQLSQRGNEKLSEKENKRTTGFEGEVDTQLTFQYGRDFFMGDIIQMRNEYGKEGKVRVTEYVISDDTNGYQEHPTFTMIEEE